MAEGIPFKGQAEFEAVTGSEAKRLKALTDQTAKLKPLPTGQMLDLAALEDLVSGKW